MKKIKLTALLFLSLGLTACGGGSGGDSTASTNTNNGGGLDEVMDLDRCVEQALFNGATTGAEALSICMGGGDNPSTGGGDVVTPKSQSVLVKAMGMTSADKILSEAVQSRYSPITTAIMICDNSVVTSNTFDNNEIEKITVLNEWRGDKQYAGYYKVSVDGRDDNCLVQATNYNYTASSRFYSEENTIYRKGKVAHIDMISTLAMARLMGTRSYTIIEDILEGQDKSRNSGFSVMMHKGHFDEYRNELPSNEAYEAAEKAIIDEIKATPQYAEAAGVIDGIIANTPSTDELLDAYNNLAERAKLLAALHKIKEDCGYTCSNENTITMYSEGNDFKTTFSL